MTARINLIVNGRPVEAEVAPRTHLADFLREGLLLTGTHIGCEHGICGACTVEIDGEIARSCITYAVVCDGARVTTIEGFDDDALMAALRRAFTEAHALQCGYCTPGMLIAARDLVRRKRGLARAEIRKEMSGNLCRCTGYQGIIDAIERVMAEATIPAAVETEAKVWPGPAPGPVARASVSSKPVTSLSRDASLAPKSPMPSRLPKVAAIKVTVGPIEQAGGATRVSQSFELPHPRDAVWALMSDIEKVAQCMPGLALGGPPRGDIVLGRLDASIGPITVSFGGEGRISQMPAEHRQVIEGQGGDRRSGSRATGSVDYRLSAFLTEDGKEGTRVDTVISYTLFGPLAQVGRSGLVRDLVRRIGEAFAQNLDARLRDPMATLQQRKLSGLSIIWSLMVERATAMVLRLIGRSR